MLRFARAFLFFSMVLIGLMRTQAQTVETDVRTGTGSIAGLVTMSGKPRENVVVSINETDRGDRRVRRGSDGEIKPELAFNHKTNPDGRYRFSNLPAGTYRVTVRSRQFTKADSEDGRETLITVDDDEAKEDVNLALIRGGVITGKVTDQEGKPLIAAQ